MSDGLDELRTYLADRYGPDAIDENAFAEMKRYMSEPVSDEYVIGYWLEHYTQPGGLCTLCGNRGTLDTTGRAISYAGIDAGKKQFCICPNGRALRQAANAPDQKTS